MCNYGRYDNRFSSPDDTLKPSGRTEQIFRFCQGISSYSFTPWTSPLQNNYISIVVEINSEGFEFHSECQKKPIRIFLYLYVDWFGLGDLPSPFTKLELWGGRGTGAMNLSFRCFRGTAHTTDTPNGGAGSITFFTFAFDFQVRVLACVYAHTFHYFRRYTR